MEYSGWLVREYPRFQYFSYVIAMQNRCMLFRMQTQQFLRDTYQLLLLCAVNSWSPVDAILWTVAAVKVCKHVLSDDCPLISEFLCSS